jgi:transcriptional regulator with XRE-family HTH domain
VLVCAEGCARIANVSTKPDETDEWRALGRVIRSRRRARSLTLVDLAGQVELSQPFLSQIENGRARPSLMSLHRLAEALDTTAQALFGGALDGDEGPSVVRADDVRLLEVDGDSADSVCHILLAGDAPFHLLEFDGLPKEFLDYFTHEGFEATYVINGEVEIDIDGVVTHLHTGDSVSYPSRLPHRLRSVGRRRARVLMIETKLEVVYRTGRTDHSPPAKAPRPRRARSATPA